MRVVIAEDNVVLAEGLHLLLAREGHSVLATAGDGATFVDAVREHEPDVCIVDVRLPPSFRDEGVHAARKVRDLRPGLPVLVFSQYVEETYAAELLADRGGGVGYLLKDRVARVGEFVEALDRVAAGGTVLDADVVEQLFLNRSNPIATLTAREREVLALMAQGHANSEIAGRLVVTDSAVHKHIGNIFEKLELPATDSGHRRVLAVLAYLGV